MFATYYSHSMLPVTTTAPVDSFSEYATSTEVQTGHLTTRLPVKQTFGQARPKIGLRRGAFAPMPEPMRADALVDRLGPEGQSLAPPTGISASPTRVYGRPRRSAVSARRGRRSEPTSPGGVSQLLVAPAKRTEVFESITCAPQLMVASFEELRVECYRVSYIATGHAPMPVTPDSVQWDTIPPFYTPSIQEVMEPSGSGLGPTDIVMSDEFSDSCAFAFSASFPVTRTLRIENMEL